MPKPPPAKAVEITERLRSGLQSLERKMVPPPLALLDFVSDFWGAHIAFALADLEIVDALASGSRTAKDVAEARGLNADMTYRLLRAGTNVDLVREGDDQTFSLTPMGEALCRKDNESFRDFIVLMGRMGARFWARLPDCVREGKTAIELETGQKPFEYLIGDVNARHLFNRAMTAVSSIAADALVAVYDFKPYRTIADIGGGEGRLLSAMLQAAPSARGVLFDLPEVVESAPPVLDALGVSGRVEIVGGSFFERVPAADLYMMKSIIHDWDDADADKILATVRQAASPGATLLLYETVVPKPGAKHFSKFLDIEMIVTAGGRERTRDQYDALLRRAGFRLTRVIPTAGPMSVIEAKGG